MFRLGLATIALGIGGFDPLGVVALAAALALGSSRRGVAFMVTAIIGTTASLGILLGVAASHAETHLRGLQRLSALPLRPLGLGVIAAGLALAGWAVVRFVRPAPAVGDAHHTGLRPRARTRAALLTTGVLVGASCLIDPAFYPMLALAGHRANPGRIVAVAIGWTLCSHSLTIVMAIAALGGSYERLNAWLTSLVASYAGPVRVALSWLIAFVALACLVQGGVLVTGHGWLLR